jgi:SAM-dependent methyltransferase
MRLLDVGCGPGNISLDLAEAVSPGETVGVDIAPVQLERARALAVERGVITARFEPADAYTLPFADASFDALFATNLLQHLDDPPARRVQHAMGAGVRPQPRQSRVRADPPPAAAGSRFLAHRGLPEAPAVSARGVCP